ncbi:hypothetical protein CHELA1G11_20766 [Hyphomicrobiales bacterium]|nr:hypothetical protein CHELA1G11_20766 [Hyphomicrobiales bacterium]CAH1691830.1 hypothetical protein CHELA1G2_21081 [Hyphomicrobiales bacterium]
MLSPNGFVTHKFVVSEGATRRARRLLWDELRVIAEPGGAAALAALATLPWLRAYGFMLAPSDLTRWDSQSILR